MTVLKYPKQSSTDAPTTLVTKFNWSPYLHLQNAKLNLSNFTVTSPFNREITYICIGWHAPIWQNYLPLLMGIKNTSTTVPVVLQEANKGKTIKMESTKTVSEPDVR